MRYAIAAAGLAATVSAWGPPNGGNWGPPGQWTAPAAYSGAWTTGVVSEWTTYCPEATQWTHSGKTFTATEATTMTITDCPYTTSIPATTWSTPESTPETSPVSSPVSSPVTYSSPVETTPESSPVTYSSPATWSTTAAPPPPVTTAPPAPYPVNNATSTWSTSVASTGSAYPSSPVATGAAAQLSAAGGLIAAVFGLVAAL